MFVYAHSGAIPPGSAGDIGAAHYARGTFPHSWGMPPLDAESRAAWVHEHATEEQARRRAELRAAADPVAASNARRRYLHWLRRYDPYDR
ncbi:hypothetical protein [Actinomadura sp. 9N215]|uniref:hypothetical protein n=1 Tax=Actinomadura sp. 9N215 TaxID=3375150 RepID=UPI00378CCDFF